MDELGQFPDLLSAEKPIFLYHALDNIGWEMELMAIVFKESQDELRALYYVERQLGNSRCFVYVSSSW